MKKTLLFKQISQLLLGLILIYSVNGWSQNNDLKVANTLSIINPLKSKLPYSVYNTNPPLTPFYFPASTTCSITGINITATGTSSAYWYNPVPITNTCLGLTPTFVNCPWTESIVNGVITYTFSKPIYSSTISYTAVDGLIANNGLVVGQDIGNVTINGCSPIILSNLCGVSASGSTVSGNFAIGFGDVKFTVSSIKPFTSITLTNIGGNSGWVAGNLCDFSIVAYPCNLQAPILSSNILTMPCLSNTADLSSITASNTPPEICLNPQPFSPNVLTWHTATPATASNNVMNLNAVGVGTYYASFYEGLTGCFGPTTAINVTANPLREPTFTQVAPICAGDSFTLPIGSTNTATITGSWSPAINNTATTTYTFTPNTGQCASTQTLTVVVNPVAITINSQPLYYQKVCLNSPAQTLIVAATGNIVSYQWYQNVNPTTGGATLIPWGTGTQFTPTTNAVGTIFYYVVIKNSTNCTLRSNIVQVTVANGTANTGVLSGLQNVCIGSTTQFASTVSGGTWTSSNPAVASVNATTGLITGITGGSASITYTKVGALCNSSVIRTVVVVTNNTLITNNDAITTYQSATPQTTTVSCISNDTLNGTLNPSGVTATQTNALITGITLNTNGTITILPSVLAGTYTIQYKITNACGQSNIGTITLTINNPVVQFVTFPGSNLISYGINTCKSTIAQTSYDLLNAATVNEGQNYGVFVNGVLATQSTVTITPIEMPTFFTLNSNYTITAAPNTPLGVYNFQVRVCATGFTTGFTTGCTIIDVKFVVISSLMINQSTIYLTKAGRALTAPNLSSTLNTPVSNLTQVVRFTCGGSTAVTTSNISVTVGIPSSGINIQLNPSTYNFERINPFDLQRNPTVNSRGLWSIPLTVTDTRPGFTNNSMPFTVFFDVNPNISRMANPNLVNNENQNNEGVIVYPNPSKGVFDIDLKNVLSETIKLELYNLLGQKIIEKNIVSETTTKVDLTAFANGTYLLKIDNGEESITKTLLKQ